MKCVVMVLVTVVVAVGGQRISTYDGSVVDLSQQQPPALRLPRPQPLPLAPLQPGSQLGGLIPSRPQPEVIVPFQPQPEVIVPFQPQPEMIVPFQPQPEVIISQPQSLPQVFVPPQSSPLPQVLLKPQERPSVLTLLQQLSPADFTQSRQQSRPLLLSPKQIVPVEPRVPVFTRSELVQQQQPVAAQPQFLREQNIPSLVQLPQMSVVVKSEPQRSPVTVPQPVITTFQQTFTPVTPQPLPTTLPPPSPPPVSLVAAPPVPVGGERCDPSRPLVDASDLRQAYHFSWCHDGGRRYSFHEAREYCTRLGSGWQPVSLENQQKDEFFSSVLVRHGIRYIWTSGNRLSTTLWSWDTEIIPSGYNNWSHTGRFGLPQPDNAEGNELCLAVLNNFYGDGVKWHDVACHHRKPVICQAPQANYASINVR